MTWNVSPRSTNVLPSVHGRSIVAEKVSCPHRIMVSSAVGFRQARKSAVKGHRPVGRTPNPLAARRQMVSQPGPADFQSARITVIR